LANLAAAVVLAGLFHAPGVFAAGIIGGIFLLLARRSKGTLT
jgi:hypothetical protein